MKVLRAFGGLFLLQIFRKMSFSNSDYSLLKNKFGLYISCNKLYIWRKSS